MGNVVARTLLVQARAITLSVDVADVAHAAERHGDVELLAENLDRLGDAGFAAGAEAVDVGAADHAGARAERERAQHVLPGADAAVEHDLDLDAHRLDDLRQRRDRRRRAVELAAAVIGDDQRARRRSWPRVLASSTSRMPLRMSLPGQTLLIHSTSFQLSAGSNWLAVHCASELTFSMPCTWPARLPKVLRLPRRIDSAQAGLVAMSMTLRELDLAAARSCRCGRRNGAGPSTCRSTVSTSALHFAAAARSISARMKPRSFIT